MMKLYSNITRFIFLIFTFALTLTAQNSLSLQKQADDLQKKASSPNSQNSQREISVAKNGKIEIKNNFGRVSISTEKDSEKAVLKIENGKESEVESIFEGNQLQINVTPENLKVRIDLTLKIPERMRVKIETSDGEVRAAGNYESLEITTGTGTIATDVPLDDIKYNFVWTASRPRFLSDIELNEIKEKAAGKFVLNGKIFEGKNLGKKNKKSKEKPEEDSIEEEDSEEAENSEETGEKKPEEKEEKEEKPEDKRIKLDFSTSRGIILLNVNPTSVPSDLGEKPLTNAAKAIIKSGDSILTEAIRRASPKYFGDYASTLPPFKSAPVLEKSEKRTAVNSLVKKVLVQVTDVNNRAVSDLKKEDFNLTERGAEREILSVEPAETSFNLVLLIDVSGSVDNYVNFIRKAARNFVNTVNPNDKVAIIIFNNDVEVLSNFTTDKAKLSASLDTFDAGGGTAYYDALAFTLAETLRPLKGERTGIVVLTDGEDTRSFLSFDSILGAIQESGALIYPLYVPNGLIAAAKNQDPNSAIDPLRARYFNLTSKAEAEGEKLAQISGGVYYPIRQLNELQKAYDDIVLQLRTAYSITFRSDLDETAKGSSNLPFLKVKVKRENAFVKLGSVVEVPTADVSNDSENNFTQNVVQENSKPDFQPVSFVKQENSPVKFINSANSAPLLREIDFSFQNLGFNNSNFQSAEISGEVEKIKYKQFVNDKLRESKFENFDINKAQGAFLLNNNKETIAVSRWISPKRTRSYPYERVYDTLAHSGKKVAIIPVVKDEGLGGDRDFLQWDTISLLSLLDVHVVLAYYDSAEKNTKRADQITAQKFDNNYILSRLAEVFEFKGTPREWNERETKQLKNVFEKAKLSYQKISKETNTYLHNSDALDELIKVAETPQKFLEFSRNKSQKAQNREFVTDQPKEALSTDTKAKVTINNALFGKYFFTCDETKIEAKTVYLIEAKHSVRAKMPSKNDIKDGFIKMMLYTNLQNVKVGSKPHALKVQIRLTANALKGSINSDASDENVNKFLTENAFTTKDSDFVKKIFQEARENNFTIILEHAVTAK